MPRILSFIILFLFFIGYSLVVYTKGTEHFVEAPVQASGGKSLFQQYNCISCHQVYGLGGYLGTDLTNVISDPLRGEAYSRALLKHGGQRMPDFKFTDDQIEQLMSYLKYIDETANTKTQP